MLGSGNTALSSRTAAQTQPGSPQNKTFDGFWSLIHVYAAHHVEPIPQKERPLKEHYCLILNEFSQSLWVMADHYG